MIPLNMAVIMRVADVPDVAESQPAILANYPCQTRRQSARITLGRTQAAFASDEGCAIGHSVAPFQEYRSRGCRRARKLSWPCAWLPLWQHVAVPSSLKSFMWTNRFRSSQPTPANTSKSVGRDVGQAPDCPAHTTPTLRRCDVFRVWVNTPAPNSKKLSGCQTGLVVRYSVNAVLRGESDWTSQSTSPSSLVGSALRPARQRPHPTPLGRNPRCRAVRNAASLALTLAADRLPQSVSGQLGPFVSPSRRLNPVFVPKIPSGPEPMQLKGDVARSFLAQALGLTPTQAYGCAHQFKGSTSC
jgi:hypothetical protein